MLRISSTYRKHFWSFPHSRLIAGFVTRLTRRIPLVEQELLPFRSTPEFTPGFQWGSCYSIFSFICMFCRSLFVILYFFFWPLLCLFFFDILIMIVPLVSSNSSITVIKFVSDLRQVCGLFSLGTPVSSNSKTDRHDITEILLKVA